MKNFFLFSIILCSCVFGALSVSAQCNPNVESPIKCSYYDEGYRDGVSDANSNRTNDYKRYRSKYVSQYESYFRNGYQAGYNSSNQGGGWNNGRWTSSQRQAYDSGYTIGQADRRRSSSNRTSESNGGYDASIGLYFQQGYADGYANRSRRYDFPVTNGGGGWDGGSGGGNNSSSATWSGRVDDRANLIIRGGSLQAQDVSATGLQTYNQNISGSLPNRNTTVTASKRSGRGEVFVIQQPSRSNNYTAIVQIVDSKGGAGDYQVDINWSGTGTGTGGGWGGGGSTGGNEPYRSGRVTWRGRVDQKTTITVNGSDVQSNDESGTGLSDVRFDITGALAHRAGNVTVRKRNGRGSVTVLQQPSWQNDFTAIIQVFDPSGGADNYEIEISW
jgi:hypothetical protein